MNILLGEHVKDRLLNVAVVCSIGLLIGGFMYQPSVKKDSTPVRNTYAEYQVKPLASTQTQVFQPVSVIPVKPQVASENFEKVIPQANVPVLNTTTAETTVKKILPKPKQTAHDQIRNSVVTSLLTGVKLHSF